MPAGVTLFIPGTQSSVETWAKAVAPHGLRFDGKALGGAPFDAAMEFIENDTHFAEAFVLPTVSDVQREAIDRAGGALVLRIDKPLQSIARELAALVSTLGRCGALAVRIEESKLGYPVKQWVDLVGSGDPALLYRASVIVLVDQTGQSQHSCGMHVFGLPDAAVEFDANSNVLLAAFNIFNLAEDPVLRTGETFAPDAETPRRVLTREYDAAYPASHPCHNPFGVWRLGPPGGTAGIVVDEAFVFIPTLAAILTAAERKKGSALSREEVEAILDTAVCMKMKPRDAQNMERARGYADIEPDRAFEQWQAMRKN